MKAGFDKVTADAAEFKAGFDKAVYDNAEQQAQVRGFLCGLFSFQYVCLVLLEGLAWSMVHPCWSHAMTTGCCYLKHHCFCSHIAAEQGHGGRGGVQGRL